MGFDGRPANTPRISAAEYVIDFGVIEPGAQATGVVAHGLGVTPSEVVGHLEDTPSHGWAHQCGWVAEVDAANVAVAIFNNGPSTASARLRFRLIYGGA